MSMLRTSKFVRYIGSLARNIVLNNSRNVDGLFIKRQNFVSQNYATAAAATASFRQNDSPIDRSIRRLDEDARRMGRISRRELEDVIEEIKSSRSATSTQSLMVIRCCGNLVPDETPEFRTKLVNNVWQILEKLGIPMDISHYNALLRVYLENEHKFSPTEFLAELERKGIEPNRVTYQRLIAGYCQKGDIEGATQILEFMREKQMPISEGVFNALILGHSKAGDMQSARGILGVMGQANLEPNSDTYAALLCGYASVGDAEALQSVFDECREKEIFLTDRDYLEIVFTLAVNNHDALVDSVLTQVPRTVGYNQDASNVVLRLTTHGKENIAYKVLQTMQPPLKHDGQVAATGGFFIRQLVKSNRPVESILDICDQLKDSGLNSRGLLIATEVALQTGNTGLALDLFKAMRDNFYPIRNHYFWPLMVKKGEENRLGVLDVIKQMSEFRVSPSRETLKDYVIPYLVPGDHVDNVTRLIGDLQSNGTSVGASASALVFHLLSKNNIKQAAEIATTYQANYSSAAPRRVLVTAYLNTNDTDSFVNIINALVQGRNSQQEGEEEEDVGFDDREFVGRILQTVVSRQKPFNLTELLQKMIDFGLGVSNSAAEQIQSQLSGTDLLTSEVSTLLSKLVSADLIPTPLERRTSVRRFLPKNEESLRNLIEKFKAKGDPAPNIKKQLFLLFCQNKELDKAKAFYQELDAEGLVTSGTHALLIDLYLQLNDLESALNQYDALLKLEPDVKLDALKTVKLATALVQADRLDDAIKFLQNQIRDDDHIEKEKSKDRPFIYSSACWRLLNTLAEKGDTEGVRKLFDVMVENKFIEPNNALLGPLVKAHLVKDDLKGAMEVFEWCCQHHRSTPFKNELACKLIQNEDANELQRLTDLSTIVHGEINSLHDLIIAFVECGRIRQARKILETPGLRVRSDRLSYAGERYQNEGLVEPLEGLIKATKDISSVDRCSLYYQLLLSYIKADDVDKAVGLWTQMQEEDVQPTDEFLHELGTFLKNKDEPVPFAIPESPKVITEKTIDDTVPASKHHRNLQRSVSDKRYSDAVAEYKLLRKANATLYPTEVTGLIELAMNTIGVKESASLVKELLSDGIQIPRFKLYYFVKSLAKTGDLNAFEDFGNYLSDEQKNMTKYKNLYCNCAIEAGKTEELLSNLEENIKNASTPAELEDITKSFPNGGVLAILDSQPDLLPRVEKLINSFSEKNIVGPINMLWMYYLTKNEDKKAEVIFNKYLKSSPRLIFRYIHNNARKVLDENRIDNLLTYVKSWEYVTNNHIGIVLSAKIDILVKKEEPEKALAIVEESLKEISIDDINYTALNRLKQSLLAKGKEFPYTIQKSSKQKQIVDESSDSDTEEISRKAAS